MAIHQTMLYFEIQHTQFEENNFYFGNITIQYFPVENTISTQWESVKNNFSKNYTLQSIFYYYLFDFSKNQKLQTSICSSFVPIHFELSFDCYLNFTNKTIPYSRVENLIITYLSLDDEDFLLAYNPSAVDIIAPSQFWFGPLLYFVYFY